MPSEITVIGGQVAKVLSKEVLTKVKHTAGGFNSNIFVRFKKVGTYRMILIILNSKPLNVVVDYHHKPTSLLDLEALWHLTILKTHTIQSP